MSRVVDWFWDGVLLKEVQDVIAYKLYVVIYAFTFAMILLINILFVPVAFIALRQNILDFSMWIVLSMMLITLAIISTVLFTVVRQLHKRFF